MTQWQVIRQEYEEQGAWLRALAAKHGVGKSTIAERKFKEQWDRNGGPLSVVVPDSRPSPRGNRTPEPPADAIAIARLGLKQLAQHVQPEALLSISEHKLLSDALATYVKVLLMAPREKVDEQDGLHIPLNMILPETR